MLWQYTLIERGRRLLAGARPALSAACHLLVLALVTFGTSPARGQSIESVVMPGAVAKSHAKIEHECSKCHVRFRPAAQPGLCQECHRDIAADLRGGTGYHGRTGDTACRRCHTDHRGREARIVVLDETKFDHRLTDYQLRGEHRGKACAGCHRAGEKHREAPADCYSCHRGNDKHRSNLGPHCEACHGEEGWKMGRFDHSKTRFPLLHRHAQVRCADCHVDERYAGTARDCVGCHRTDDAHRGHNGPRCESCHTEQDWRSVSFRHDRDAGYPLVGRHQTVGCNSCHRAPLYRDRLATQCAACHQQDDAHGGVLGGGCGSCHHPEGWQAKRFAHDLSTRFPLKARHRVVKCESCHTAPGLRESPPLSCVGCHARDDRERGHKGRFGGRCESCHGEQAWREVIFEHSRDTKFATAGKHRQVKCDACHRSGPYAAKADSRCHACHKEDDIHFASFGEQCDRCHLADDWRKISREATDKYCRGRANPAPDQASEERLNVNFWIPFCAAERLPAARSERRSGVNASEKGLRP